MRYAITNLNSAAPVSVFDSPEDRRGRWLTDLQRWVAAGVDFVQLREKTLEAGELLALARSAVEILEATNNDRSPFTKRPKLLLNSRPDIAAAARAGGVHLTSRPGELRPSQVREVFRAAGLTECTVSCSCHTLPEVLAAREHGADLLLFGPVFEKRIGPQLVAEGTGLALLEEACRLAHPLPVLALGGVTRGNLQSCLDTGARGIAGIRLFA